MSLTLVGPARDPAARILSSGVVLGSGDPPAVARLVVPSWVASVDLVAEARSLTHVFEEVLEGQPPLADDDAPSAIARVRRIARVSAAAKHRTPRLVSRRLRPAVPVRRRPLARIAGQLGSGFSAVGFSLHRVRHSTVVARHVLAHAITAFIDSGVLAAAARAELRLQRGAVLLVPLRFGDPTFGLFGVAPALSSHNSSVFQPKAMRNSPSSEGK